MKIPELVRREPALVTGLAAVAAVTVVEFVVRRSLDPFKIARSIAPLLAAAVIRRHVSPTREETPGG